MMQSSMMRYFGDRYQSCRENFLTGARVAEAELTSHILPGHVGADGEQLAMDIAYLGPREASRLLIISSGTHGPEGLCGSGCQVTLLHDSPLLALAQSEEIGILLVHAVNPYGFSWLHRTNEDNVDLNRNAVTFPRESTLEPDFEAAQALLLTPDWPRTASQQAALDAYCRDNGGLSALWKLLSKGQYALADGLFYGGERTSWSVSTLRAVLGQYAAHATDLAWIDVHTGLGPFGHGEKICPGRAEEVDFVRSLWGSDILVPASGASVSGGVSGSVIKLIHDMRPQARVAIMGLEFGTLPYDQVLDSLVADTWMRQQTLVADDLRAVISRQVRDAFYCDIDAWKGAVLGQARVIWLQSLRGLAARVQGEPR